MNSYDLNQCLLYRVTSKEKLAEALQIPIYSLKKIEFNPLFRHVEREGKHYFPPVGELRMIHDRIFSLLKKVKSRDYHMSDKKESSNVKNAGSHNPEYSVFKTDIKNYFPSVPEDRIVQFFYKKLQTSKPVANTLGRLLCRDGFLVKGSPVSGFLAFWANIDMFDKIAKICKESNAEFTLFVDDLTVSTQKHTPKLLRRIDGIIKQFGYIPHKQKIYKPQEEKIITGVVLSTRGYSARKSTYRKMSKKEQSSVRKGAMCYANYVNLLNRKSTTILNENLILEAG